MKNDKHTIFEEHLPKFVDIKPLDFCVCDDASKPYVIKFPLTKKTHVNKTFLYISAKTFVTFRGERAMIVREFECTDTHGRDFEHSL